MKTYSFIIPHHNCPNLLNHLLNTIPQRDDIEVIVVDDNSDEDKKPQIRRSDVQLVLISKNESKGAGHARNVGLDLAKGKWLLFADSDDFYERGFLNELDKYKDSDNDIVFFSAHVMYEPTHPERSNGINYIEKVYNRYVTSDKSEYEFRHFVMRTNVPWNKMFRHDFITEIGNRFESVPVGNDAWFCKFAGSKAKSAAIINQRLYYYVKYDNNTTFKKRPLNDYYLIIKSCIRRHKLLKQYDMLDDVPILGFYAKNVKRDFGYFVYIKLVIYSLLYDPTIINIIISKIKKQINLKF